MYKVNCLIQVLWVVLSFAIGIYVAYIAFDSLLWRCIFGGIFSFLTYGIFVFIKYYIKAFNDPDVQRASSLGMSITKYRKLKGTFEEIQKEAEWQRRFGIGDQFRVIMDEGSPVYGTIIDIDFKRQLYIVSFKESISLMPSEEPANGWSDNAYPSKILELSDNDLLNILSKKLIGTSIHYHF